MFILEPTQPKVFGKDDIEIIEEVVRDSRLVDEGINELKKFSHNAPRFDPDRRRFLRHAAVLAGLYASGQLLKGCATAQEPVQFQGKTYSDWEAYLLTQDLIRGPSLLIHPRNGLPNDFHNHVDNPINQGWGAVDYDVPGGTPLVPTADAYATTGSHARIAGTHVIIGYGDGYTSIYGHMSSLSPIIPEKTVRQFLNKLTIVGFSGDTGMGGGTVPRIPHLHFDLRWENTNQPRETRERKSLNPFELGIDQKSPLDEYAGFKGRQRAARPAYWDGKTEINASNRNKRLTLLKESLDTLEERLKLSDLDKQINQELLKRLNKAASLRSYLAKFVPRLTDAPFDKATVKELLERQIDAYELRDYIGERVLLTKRSAPDGKRRYEFMPGSLMYTLMLELYPRTSRHEFIAMLPFIFPPLKDVYQKANPGVQL